MEAREEPCPDCQDLINQNDQAPHEQLLEMSAMPDHKLYNCFQCGAFPTFNLHNAQWEVEVLLSVEIEN